MSWDVLIPELIRPQALWLWVLLPLLWWWSRRGARAGGWEQVVDAHLLAALLEQGRAPSRWRGLVPALAWMVAVLALAGPSWGNSPVSLERRQAPLVVVIELSDALHQTDVPPSRLLRLRAKLGQLLDQRRDGALALVVYGGDAYTVVPLTEDVANVSLFVDALGPEVMPQPGRDMGRALDWTAGILGDTGQATAQVLVMASHADAAAPSAAARLRDTGVRVSVIGVGPSAGWDMGALSEVAARGGGGFSLLTGDTTDLTRAGVLSDVSGGHRSADQRQDQLRDDGPWLLPLVLLLLLPRLRAGGGLLACVVMVPLLAPMPAQASVDGWWQRADQQAHAQLSEGVAAYRRGDFTAAEAAFRQQGDAVSSYNLGNALARQGRLEEALQAYDRALAEQPRMDDAEANRRAVLEALKRQKKQKEQNNPKGGQGNSDQDKRDARGQGQNDQASSGQQRQAGPPASAQQDAGKSAVEPASQPSPKTPSDESVGSDQNDRKALPHGRPAEPAQEAQQRLHESWLERVPDDPAALLRQKLRMENARRQWQK